MSRYLCIDMGGTTIKYGVVDEHLEISAFGKIPTEINDYDVLLNDIIGIIEPHAKDCDGISLSIPGAIEAEAGKIRAAGAIECLCYQPLGEALTERFQLPVAMENDANCAALAEFHSGVGKDTNNMVLIVLGTGIGGTIIANGQLLHTKNHFSGEFGYLIMEQREPKAWDELHGSVVKIIQHIQRCDPALKEMDGAQIFDLYHQHPVVTEHLDDFFRMLAIGCYNIEAMLDPDLIVIAGGVSSRDDFADNLEVFLNDLDVNPKLKNPPVVKVAQYRNHANLIGAYHNINMRR